MGLKKYLVNQCRKPHGRWGRIVARKMNKEHAKLAKWGISNISIKSNYSILDVGCGGGKNVFAFTRLAPDGKVIGIDYSEVSVSVSKEYNQEFIKEGRVEIYHGSVSSLPFEENTFDLVSGFEAYYFWPDLIKDLKGIYKVLKPNGTLILINEGYKCKNEEKRKLAEKWAKIGNFTIHTPLEYKEFLSLAGFLEIKIYEKFKEGWIAATAKKII